MESVAHDLHGHAPQDGSTPGDPAAFGQLLEALTGGQVEADSRLADLMFRAVDKNNNGKLDRDEMGPAMELAELLAQLLGDGDEKTGASGGGGGRDGGSGESGEGASAAKGEGHGDAGGDCHEAHGGAHEAHDGGEHGGGEHGGGRHGSAGHGDHAGPHGAEGGSHAAHSDHDDHSDHADHSDHDDHAAHGASGAHGGHRKAQSGDVMDGAALLGLGSVDEDGNIPPAGSHATNGHSGHDNGHPLNANDVVNAARRVGMSDDDITSFVEDYKSDPSNYNPNQSPEQKSIGAAVALNVAVASHSLNADGMGLSKTEMQERGAEAVNAAMRGDGGAIREALGGDANPNLQDMTDQDLVNVWGMNTHMYNHAIMSGDGFEATHLMMRNTSPSDNTAANSLVGYNDKGAWPQWDWHDAMQSFERDHGLANYVR